MKTKLWIMLIAFIFIIFACKKEDNVIVGDDIPEELVGTWIWESTEDLWIGHTKEYILVSFSKEEQKSGLFEVTQVADWQAENVFHVIEATKGTFTVKGNTMYFEPTHFGSEFGANDEPIYDTTMWWGQDDPYFSNWEFIDKATFGISGNTLTIYSEESTIFTKVN